MDFGMSVQLSARFNTLFTVVTLITAFINSEVCAQSAANYPNRAMRWIVGYTPGGTADMLARAVGAKFTEAWGQAVIVENRPGGATNIATELVAKSAPDGYTLLLGTVANVINPALYAKMPFDFQKDFIHITNMASTPGIVVVHPSVPAKNAKELVALAKARPGQLRHGSTGIGSPHHLAGELFKHMAEIKMIHVPYKGATPALTDVVAGHIEIYFGAMVSTIPHVKSHRVRALAMTSAKRSPAAPEIATLQEQGFKGFETGSWFGLHVPVATPRDIVNKLHTETLRAINLPEIRNRMQPEGAEFIGDTPEHFTAYIRAEIEKWGRAVKVSGAKAEG
jgi:tripartite-type tricarboxylate transporter receptor subunit TctC